MTGTTAYRAAKPWLDDGDLRLYHGDVLDVLGELPAGIAQTCVTSPPYWGLRDYGTGTWRGGDPDCEHRVREHPSIGTSGLEGGKDTVGHQREGFKDACPRCGAQRVDQQLGLEPTPDAYIQRMVEVFREVRRVLRDDGTLWLNIGDSYGSGTSADRNPTSIEGPDVPASWSNRSQAPRNGLKPKDLVGIPWRLAFALQNDGWVLRSDITWAKPNPMPESVTDRPTKAHEMVFMFAKATWSGPEPGRFARISDQDARWVALLFDTEGNIVIKRSERPDGRIQYGAQMAFANCSRPLLERAQAIIGCGTILTRSGKNAPVHYWQLSNGDARDLLHRIYPFLIVKQRQARVAIYMQDVVAEPKRRPGGYRTPEHAALLERCWQTIKALNQFGDPDVSWAPEPKYGGWSGCARYFYDADAVREGAQWFGPNGQPQTGPRAGEMKTRAGRNGEDHGPLSRNLRSVWQIATQPFPEAHFATYPEELVRRCILAGTSEQGGCAECGAPWRRITETTYTPGGAGGGSGHVGTAAGMVRAIPERMTRHDQTTGWEPSCACLVVECLDCGWSSTNVREVLGTVPGESEASPPAVLLEGVLESVDGREASIDQGLRDRPEGLPAPATAGSSDGESRGLLDGASPSDGGAPWADADEERDRPPSERRQGGQPDREPEVDGQERPRPDAEAAASPDRVSALRRSDPAATPCPQCDGRLSAKPPAVVPQTALDPFVGSGTTALVARKHGRRSIGIDLSAEYLEIAARRTQQLSLLGGAA